jgi:hypothetical protein
VTTTTLSTAPVRRSTVVRWLAAMLEQARIRRVDNPEFADLYTA